MFKNIYLKEKKCYKTILHTVCENRENMYNSKLINRWSMPVSMCMTEEWSFAESTNEWPLSVYVNRVFYLTNNISWTFFFSFCVCMWYVVDATRFFSSTCFNFNQILYIFVGFYLINNFNFCLTIWFYTSMCLFYWAFFSLFLSTQNRQNYTIFRFEATIVFMSLLFFSCKKNQLNTHMHL